MAKHSEALRESVLDRIRGGESYRDINADTGVSLGVLSKWAKDAEIEPANAAQTEAAANATRIKWTERRGALTDRLGAVIEQLLDRVEDPATSARGARDLAWSAAVFIDKAQLLSGGVTSRHEQLDAARRRERIQELQDEVTQLHVVKDEAAGG